MITEKLQNFLDLIKKENLGKLPDDLHVTRKAGALVAISQGNVIKIQKPGVLHCPLFTSLFSHEEINAGTIRDKFERQIENWKMFTAGRHLCDDRIVVPFGASEMMMYALKRGSIDAAITVCEGAGTVISANPALIQGIGAYMNGLFYTTPVPAVIKNIEKDGGIVLSPENAEMNQFKGAIKAIESGYLKIAVTVRGDQQQEIIKIRKLEKSLNKEVKIVILAVCNSGITLQEAETVAKYSDLAWSCASKHIRDIAGPLSILQVGMKIPVFVLTLKGIDFISSYSKDKNLQEILNADAGSKHYITAAGYKEGAIKLNMGKFSVYLYETGGLPVAASDEPGPLL